MPPIGNTSRKKGRPIIDIDKVTNAIKLKGRQTKWYLPINLSI
jgi:hypothetical protein